MSNPSKINDELFKIILAVSVYSRGYKGGVSETQESSVRSGVRYLISSRSPMPILRSCW